MHVLPALLFADLVADLLLFIHLSFVCLLYTVAVLCSYSSLSQMERILLMLSRIGAMIKGRLVRPDEMVSKINVLLQELVAVEGPSFEDKISVLKDLVEQGLVSELQSQIAGESLVSALMQGQESGLLGSNKTSSQGLFRDRGSELQSQALVSFL